MGQQPGNNKQGGQGQLSQGQDQQQGGTQQTDDSQESQNENSGSHIQRDPYEHTGKQRPRL